MVPGSVEDERMLSALKYLKSPQRNSLKEMHTNVCARGFKSMEYDFMFFPYPDAIGRWLDAKKKRGRTPSAKAQHFTALKGKTGVT
eukprot:1142527-Pelagomonas_calceolata.AAC.4